MSNFDRHDSAIVNLLMEDGRMSAAEIAQRSGGISERAVRYRIKRLTTEGLMRVSAIVNPKALGYSLVADIWLEVETSQIMDVARKLAELENISYVACSIGERDVSVQVVGHSADEIYDFVTNVIGKIPGVRKTVTSIVPLILKDVYQWRIPASVFSEKEKR